MGQELIVSLEFKSTKTNKVNEFLVCYWRKGWGITDKIMNTLKTCGRKISVSEDGQELVLGANGIYDLRDLLFEELRDTESDSFQRSFWGAYRCYQQTVSQFGNLTAWIQFWGNRFNVLDELENAQANGESPCFDGCFDPDALNDMFTLYTDSEAIDKEKEFIWVLHHLDEMEVTLKIGNYF